MNADTIYSVVRKLVGPIRPTGMAHEDPQRLENLKAMCEVVEALVGDLDTIVHDFQFDHQSSVKKIVDQARKSLKELEPAKD
jgi:enoyl-[acyl-carrier-protein] reductase (NADH)